MSEIERVYRGAASRSIPVEVMLELTHHCNFRCEHCYIPDFAAPDQLTTARVLALLDELAEIGTLVLALSGGEPLLRRDLWTIAERARDLGFDLHLFTNGSLVGDREAERFRALNATAHVSLYTLDEARFDAFVERPGAFAKVIAGIHALRRHQVRTVLKVPLMTINLQEVAAIRAFADQVGATCRASPFVTAKKNGDLGPLRFRVAPAELFQELGGPVLGCGTGKKRDPDAPLCAAATRYACITSSGDVMACNILPGADANIRDRPFADAWHHSPWLKTIRNLRLADLPTCQTCDRFAYCGRCTAQALAEDGALTAPSTEARRRAEQIEASQAESLG